MSSNLKVNTILPSTGSNIGIGTNGGELVVDGGCKVQVGTALTLGHSIGLQYATQNLHSAGFEINQINASGIITASQFKGDGSQLTGISAGTSLSGSTNNTVCTVTGANAIQGEANLTFDGTELKIGGDSSVAGTFGLEVYNTASNEGTALIAGTQGARLDIMDTGSSERIRIAASGAIYFISYKSGDDIIFQNTTGSGTAEVFRVKTDGIKVTSKNAHGSAIQMYNTDSSSNVWYVNGEGNSFIGHTYPRTDANMDLGFHTGYRWRDLIVSGGVRFGASADAHYLDDYEEGTYTPTINVGTFSTFLTHRYVKIGRLVHLHGGMIFNNNTSSTRVEISNIPFTQIGGGQFVGNVWLRRTSTGERNWNMILGEAGTNIMGIFRDSNGTDMGGHLSYSDFQHSSTYFNYSITYMASS